jgi:hypothetical protein
MTKAAAEADRRKQNPGATKMRKPQKIALAAVMALGLAGAAAIPAFSADPASQDQGAAAPAGQGKSWHHMQGMHGMHGMHHGGGWMSPRFVDARVAFLRTALKITDAQDGAFQSLAKVMRDDAAAREKMHESMQGAWPKTSLDRLELHAKMAEQHAQHLATFVAAYKSLYDGLSEDQRKAADELFAPHFHRG